jgi:hypothetical protein
MPRYVALPPNLPPRGLCREASAEYVGVGATKFDQMVADGRMPKPFAVDSRKLWDRHALDRAFDALCGDLLPPDADTTWSDVHAP